MNRERVERQLRRWEHTRAGGVRRFVVVWGVLAWGLSTALLSSALIIRSEHYGLGMGLGVVTGFLVASPAFGALWGYAMWMICEWMYRVQKWRLERA
jgi:hypothetical protein